MGSLADLNAYSQGNVAFTDSRDPGPRFNFDEVLDAQLTTGQQTFPFYRDQLEILDVVRPEVASLQLVINVSGIAGAVVNFPPEYLDFVSGGGGVYVFSYITSVTDWQAIRNTTITIPDGFEGSFFYDVELIWQTTTGQRILSWQVGEFVPVSKYESVFTLSTEAIVLRQFGSEMFEAAFVNTILGKIIVEDQVQSLNSQASQAVEMTAVLANINADVGALFTPFVYANLTPMNQVAELESEFTVFTAPAVDGFIVPGNLPSATTLSGGIGKFYNADTFSLNTVATQTFDFSRTRDVAKDLNSNFTIEADIDRPLKDLVPTTISSQFAQSAQVQAILDTTVDMNTQTELFAVEYGESFAFVIEVTEATQFSFGLHSETGTFTIDWGDGVVDTDLVKYYDSYTTGEGNPIFNGARVNNPPPFVPWMTLHTYTTPGTYLVQIFSEQPMHFFNPYVDEFGGDSGNESQSGYYVDFSLITQFLSLPEQGLISLADTFRGATNLASITVQGVQQPDSLFQTFKNCASLNQPVTWIDTSQITDRQGGFYRTFAGCTTFNQPVNHFVIPQIPPGTTGDIDRRGMWMFATFEDCAAFNQDLSNWDVSAVTYFDNMFRDATAFNGDITTWDVTGSGTGLTNPKTNLRGLFQGASSFNQDITVWDMSNVLYIETMFAGASTFNQPIQNWNLSGSYSLSSLFNGATSFNQPIGSWNISVTEMINTFKDATAFNQDISSWDVSNVRTFNGLGFVSAFENATSFNQPLNAWRFSTVSACDMSRMFKGATSFNQPLDQWNVDQLDSEEYMDEMFMNATAFDQDISGWCVEQIPTKPTDFDTNTNVNWTTAEKPNWGAPC